MGQVISRKEALREQISSAVGSTQISMVLVHIRCVRSSAFCTVGAGEDARRRPLLTAFFLGLDVGLTTFFFGIRFCGLIMLYTIREKKVSVKERDASL